MPIAFSPAARQTVAVATVAVPTEDVERFCAESLMALHVPAGASAVVARIYRTCCAREAGHHDLDAFPDRLSALAAGRIDPLGHPTLVGDGGAVARLDGHNALGELCAWAVTEQAITAARQFGIGFATVAHSNHFLAAWPYVRHAVDQGLIVLICSRTWPSMGTPGAGSMVIGNNPLGFGAPTADGPDFCFDFSLAYASWGRLAEMAGLGLSIPSHWASTHDGTPTVDPTLALQGGPEPIGGHKGVALALMVEVLTSVLAGAALADEGFADNQLYGIHSQCALVIDPVAMASPAPAQRTARLLARVAEMSPAFRTPGARSQHATAQADATGALVDTRILDVCDTWSDRLNVQPMARTSSPQPGGP